MKTCKHCQRQHNAMVCRCAASGKVYDATYAGTSTRGGIIRLQVTDGACQLCRRERKVTNGNLVETTYGSLGEAA